MVDKPRQCTENQRHYFVNKGLYSFSTSQVQMWELDIKKIEHWRTDAFELWWWRRLLRVPWTARRSNRSILEESNPEYALEGLMLKLKLQSFGHLMWRTDSLEKILMLEKMAGGAGDDRGWDGWMALSGECMLLSSLSRHNKDLEWQKLKPPRHVTALGSWIDCVIALRSQKDHVIALRQISVTAQCYSSILCRR